MAPFDLSSLFAVDFVGSLNADSLAFRLFKTPEVVELNKENSLVTCDNRGFAGPDPRTFDERLIDCFKSTGTFFHQDIKTAVFQTDQVMFRLPKKLFYQASVSQEQAWSAWLLAVAARQAINDKDGAKIHREQTLVDALLLRFRSIVELAPLPEGNKVKEVTAAQNFQLKVETAGLIRAAEDLMSLTRELKEMWLFGPLRFLSEGEAQANAKIEENVKAVTAIMDSLTWNEDGEQKSHSHEAKLAEDNEGQEQAGNPEDDVTEA